MRVIRALPKELLKKMFLKVLYENDIINITASRELNFLAIICEILTEKFNVMEFSEGEFNEILKVVTELEKEGFIQPDYSALSLKQKVLTEKGRQYVKDCLLNFSLPDFDIEKFLSRSDIKEHCLEDYLKGDYETAILKAFRLLEDAAVKKGIPSRFIDKDKLSGSYVNAQGVYKEADGDELEYDTLQRIMLGTMLWLKKPVKGTTSSYTDSHAAAQILIFANIQLNIIDRKKVVI